jgi:hypothetical protein
VIGPRQVEVYLFLIERGIVPMHLAAYHVHRD